jgi:hypothetical protein
MKNLFLMAMTLFQLSAYASRLQCESSVDVEGYKQGHETKEKIIFTADIGIAKGRKIKTKLINPLVTGAYLASADSKNLFADSTYRHTSETYKDMIRFSMANHLFLFKVLLPSTLLEIDKGIPFTGYIQIADESAWLPTQKLSCTKN